MERSSDAATQARVFFALWPDEAVRRALYGLSARQQARYGGRRMRADTLHLTLLFVGEVDVARLPALMQAADEVVAESFTWSLDRVACWRHNRIAYAAPATACAGLERLVEALRTAVSAADFSFDRRAFRPHVTLLRNVERMVDEAAIPPIRWDAAAFVLVRSELSERGAQYRILRHYPLGSSSVTKVPPAGPAA